MHDGGDEVIAKRGESITGSLPQHDLDAPGEVERMARNDG
jgi:hypothetical protein